jgi:hypothetical protein
MAAMRVVQWTTGIVGSTALRAILDDPQLELVGVFAHSADKVGRDAGALAGRPDAGITATDDVAALLALKPDCVVYMPHWPDIDVLERILRSGCNVVTTARLVSGEHYPGAAGERLRAAAAAGNATLVGTGMNPMFVPTMALAASGMCREVRRISVTESLDCAMYDSADHWSEYGYGQPPDVERLHKIFWDSEPDYREALDGMAQGIGLEIDEISLAIECAVAVEDRDLGFMQIGAGMVSGVDAAWSGRSDGVEIAELRTIWTLGSIFGHRQEPEWSLLHGYKIRVDGEPNVKLKLSFIPDDFENFDIGITTAMPAINAIPGVVQAAAGVLPVSALPIITGRGQLRHTAALSSGPQ